MTSITRKISLPLLASLALLGGCKEPELRFEDDLDLQYDLLELFVPDFEYGEGLHNPYLAGAEFEIYIWDDNDVTSFKGWTVRSSDESVLQILDTYRTDFDWDPIEEYYPDHPFIHDDKDEDYVLVVRVKALAPGVAELSAYDRTDDNWGTATIEVATPNEVVLRPAGEVFLEGESESATPLDATPQLIGGGTATFLVDWRRDGQPLAGDGVVTASSASPLILDTWGRETYYDERRDWLTVSTDFLATPEASEAASVEIFVNGNVAQAVDFTIVGDAAVDELRLRKRDESIGIEGEWRTVLASAHDAEGEQIWGVEFDWDLDGVDEPGEGDMFRYLFDPDVESVLGAEYAGTRVETTILGDEGFVASSNDVPQSCFCSADVDAPGRGIGFGALSLLALLGVRRRRV